jgi:hypothetical protein
MEMSSVLAELLLESLPDPEVVLAVRVVVGAVLRIGLQLWWWWSLRASFEAKHGEPRHLMAPHF